MKEHGFDAILALLLLLQVLRVWGEPEPDADDDRTIFDICMELADAKKLLPSLKI